MSEGFLNNARIIKDTRTRLPDGTSTVYDPGHVFQDRIDGTRFINEGDRNGAIFGHFPANRYELVERFLRRPALNAVIATAYDNADATNASNTAITTARVIANKDWEVVGTNMTTALSTFSPGGGIVLTTAGADEDQAIVTPHLDATQSAWAAVTWSTADRVIFETTIVTGASIAAEIVWAGLKLTNDNVIATDADQAFLRYEAGVNSGNWGLQTSDNGVDATLNDTGVTVAVSTSYHIKLIINTNKDVIAFINGVMVARNAAAVGTADDEADFIPYIGVEASAAAAKNITCRGVRMSKDFND